MEHLEVRPARLVTAADTIEAAGKGIDDALVALRSEAQALSGLWSGEAREAFIAAHTQFDSGMTARAEAVQALCTALRTLAQAYSDVDLHGAQGLGAGA
jgi:WXG100 family type VII secretion target